MFLDAACKFLGNLYDVLYQNCNDFTDQISQKLTGKRIPEYVNRAAGVGRKFVKRNVQVQGEMAKVVAY